MVWKWEYRRTRHPGCQNLSAICQKANCLCKGTLSFIPLPPVAQWAPNTSKGAAFHTATPWASGLNQSLRPKSLCKAVLESVGSGSERPPPSDLTQSEGPDASAASLLFPLEESVCCQGGWVRPRRPGSSLRALSGLRGTGSLHCTGSSVWCLRSAWDLFPLNMCMHIHTEEVIFTLTCLFIAQQMLFLKKRSFRIKVFI